jgi:hypothetical protein
MVVYLGIMKSQSSIPQIKRVLERERPSLLQSFYYDRTRTLSNVSDDIMYDSGAFTMFSSCKNTSSIDWNAYADEYADFIRNNNIKLYIELDIDSIVGYERVKILRRRIEERVGWQCIPVWHKSRGLIDFFNSCTKYKYVSIGGIVSKEIKASEYFHLKTLINEAHKRDCKIHGLGFTKIDLLGEYKFDSVVSISWKTGNMFGHCYHFDGKRMLTIKRNGFKMIGGRDAFANDLNEWIKFQKYAKEYL